MLALARPLSSYGIDVPVTTVILISGTLIPLLVGVVTKVHISSWAKALTNVVLSALAAALIPVIHNRGHLVWETFAITIVVTMVTSQGAYGLWKALGISDLVQSLTAGFGLGKAITPASGGLPLITDPGAAVKAGSPQGGTAVGAVNIAAGQVLIQGPVTADQPPKSSSARSKR